MSLVMLNYYILGFFLDLFLLFNNILFYFLHFGIPYFCMAHVWKNMWFPQRYPTKYLIIVTWSCLYDDDDDEHNEENH